MDAAVYLLCAGTAFLCCALLWRGYRKSRAALLFWSCLCFASLTADNLLLFGDRVLLPSVHLTLPRAPVALVAVLLLLYGLIWNSNPK